MNVLSKLLARLLESYLVVMVLALGAGLFFSPVIIGISSYSTLLLQAIFFVAGLKLDFGETRAELKRPFRLFLATVFMLVVFPLVAYPVVHLFLPEAALGIMLLAAMPTGMTAPLFATLAGGSEGLALVLTVLTSLAAPLTVPVVTRVAVGSSIEVDGVGMFLDLLYVIFLPLILAQLARRIFKTRVMSASFTFKPTSIALLGLLIAAVTAKNAGPLATSLRSDALPILVALVFFFVFTHLVGYYTAFHRSRPERISYAISLSYMNFVTAIYLAERFFPDPNTILTTVLAIVPWTLMFVPFRAWALGRPKTAAPK